MLVAGLGWSFGAFLSRHAPIIRHYEHGFFAVVVFLALLAHGARRWRERTRSNTLQP
jgi:membrane protein DedA with SNARE-associated domain